MEGNNVTKYGAVMPFLREEDDHVIFGTDDAPGVGWQDKEGRWTQPQIRIPKFLWEHHDKPKTLTVTFAWGEHLNIWLKAKAAGQFLQAVEE